MAIKTIDIAPQEKEQIKIRGMIFDICANTETVVEQALEIEEEKKVLKDINPEKAYSKTEREKVYAFVKRVTAFIDEILGKGAVAKIAGVDGLERVNFDYAVLLYEKVVVPVLEVKKQSSVASAAKKYDVGDAKKTKVKKEDE